MEHKNRARQRHLRLSGDLPPPPTTPFRPRDAHSDRVRTATPIRPTRGLKPSMATPRNPGHIKVSRHAGAVHGCETIAVLKVTRFPSNETIPRHSQQALMQSEVGA